MIDPIHDPTNLSIPAFPQGDVETGPIAISFENHQIALRGPSRLTRLAVDQIEPFLDLLDLLVVEPTTNRDVVALVHAVSGVRQSIGQLTIVGQQQEA